MFPYRVDNPLLGPALVTAALVALNCLAWVALEGMGSDAALLPALCDYGLIPAALLGNLSTGAPIALGEGASCTVGSFPAWLTPLSSMFLHGGWFHLLGNMWFLWLFGRNVEDVMGAGRYASFYLLAGLAAAAAQVVADPASRLPMVGASGAISGVMGAYLVLFPRVRVHIWLLQGIFPFRFSVPAYVMLLYWFGLQVLGANVADLQAQGGGVAFAAHIGGFVAGLLLVTPFKNRELLARRAAALQLGRY
jgi:membrane associated rhomboid family serine protease